jgi:hypothetical protein
MPVDAASRYRLHPTVEHVVDGRPTVAVGIRLQPDLPDGPLYQHRLTGVEDIEYLAWRYLGRSTAWWAIADANPLAFPLDVRPGQTVQIPDLGDIGRVVRTRTFA